MSELIRILYTSAAVRKAIFELFSDAERRRVAISAFVGSGAEKFLPFRRGLHLVCSPTPGATSPHTIRKLLQDGVQVEFVDRLHMKVYWAEGKGCVIGSANLSRNARGMSSLKEIGALLGPGALDIDHLLNSLDLKSTDSDLPKLDIAHRVLAARDKRFRFFYKAASFLEWYNMPHRPSWSLLWFEGSEEQLSKTTRQQVKAQFPGSESHNWFWSRKRTVEEGDWILCVPTRTAVGQTAGWVYVHRLFDVPVRERIDGYRFEAVQIHRPAYYEAPPFSLADPKIKRTIKALTASRGGKELESPQTPHKNFVEALLAAARS